MNEKFSKLKDKIIDRYFEVVEDDESDGEESKPLETKTVVENENNKISRGGG